MKLTTRERSSAVHVAAAVTVIGLGAAPLAHAAWDIVPDIQLGIYTEDNPRMSTDIFGQS